MKSRTVMPAPVAMTFGWRALANSVSAKRLAASDALARPPAAGSCAVAACAASPGAWAAGAAASGAVSVAVSLSGWKVAE